MLFNFLILAAASIRKPLIAREKKSEFETLFFFLSTQSDREFGKSNRTNNLEILEDEHFHFRKSRRYLLDLKSKVDNKKKFT